MSGYTLPIWKTYRDVKFLLNRSRNAIANLMLYPCLIISALIIMYPKRFSLDPQHATKVTAFGLLIKLVVIILIMRMFILTIRLVLFADAPTRKWSSNETWGVVYSILSAIVLSFFSFLIFATTLAGGVAFGVAVHSTGNIPTLLLLPLIAVPAIFIILIPVRFSLSIPAAVAGLKNPIREAWRISKGNAFRLLFLIGLPQATIGCLVWIIYFASKIIHIPHFSRIFSLLLIYNISLIGNVIFALILGVAVVRLKKAAV